MFQLIYYFLESSLHTHYLQVSKMANTDMESVEVYLAGLRNEMLDSHPMPFQYTKSKKTLDLVNHQAHLGCVLVFPPFVHAIIHRSAILVL